MYMAAPVIDTLVGFAYPKLHTIMSFFFWSLKKSCSNLIEFVN